MTTRHVHVVASFDELVSTPFSGEVNALCWPRRLDGDFAQVIARLAAGSGITSIDDDDLRALDLTPAGDAARAVLLADQAMMRDAGLDPGLDVVTGYPEDATRGPIPTDVYSFHADSAAVAADTYLCTYVGACSEGLPNADAIRRIDELATRARLLALHGGPDDETFAAYLADNAFDLHYLPRANAEPYAFGTGNLWRIAIQYPGAPVAPCIHRAPRSPLPRLLLIS